MRIFTHEDEYLPWMFSLILIFTQGDTGGPLTVETPSGQYTLVGVTSYNSGDNKDCASVIIHI